MSIIKHCRKCSTDKPIDEFYANQSLKDGKDNYCKSCRKNTYRLRNPKKIKEKEINANDLLYKEKQWEFIGTHNRYDPYELDYLLYNDLDITQAFYNDCKERDNKKRKYKKRWKK